MDDENHKPKADVAKPWRKKSRGAISPTAWFCAGVAILFAALSIVLSYNHEWAAAAGVFPFGVVACLMFAQIDADSAD